MKIDTRDKLKNWLKVKLGYPILKVELTDEMLDIAINEAIELFTEYAHDGDTRGSFLLECTEDIMEYKLPNNIKDIQHISVGADDSIISSNNMMSILMTQGLNSTLVDTDATTRISELSATLSTISAYKTLFEKFVNYDFNTHSKKLKFLEKIEGAVVIECVMEYEIDETSDLIFNYWIIKNIAYAKVLIQLGTVTGKYDSEIISGSRINYDRMQSDGKELLEQMMDELYENIEPLGIYVF